VFQPVRQPSAQIEEIEGRSAAEGPVGYCGGAGARENNGGRISSWPLSDSDSCRRLLPRSRSAASRRAPASGRGPSPAVWRPSAT